MTISSEVDERTLREISLVPFEAAVLEAGTWSVMAAYNRLHGTYCSEHPLLHRRCCATSGASTASSCRTGTARTARCPPRTPASTSRCRGRRSGSARSSPARCGRARSTRRSLDDKVRRRARAARRAPARLDAAESARRAVDRRSRRPRASRGRAAAESFVLLRNPTAFAAARRRAARPAAARGDRAERRRRGDPGRRQRARVTPARRSRRSAGIARAVRRRVSRRARARLHELQAARRCSTRPCSTAPLQVAYFAGRERAGEPVLVEPRRPRLVHVHRPFTPEVPEEFSVRITGTVVAPETGEWTFSLVQVGRARLSIDGEVVVDNWNPTGRSEAFIGFGSAEVTADDRARRGRARTRSRSSTCRPRRRWAGWRSGACRPRPPTCSTARSRSRARPTRSCCVVGTDGDWESEGNDRESMACRPPQDELDRARSSAVNPRTASS